MTAQAQTREAQPEPVALFVSDLHLHAAAPATTRAFFDFLEGHARHARQLYLLGDLFEYWAGDDDLSDSYNRQVAAALRRVRDAGVELYWMAGNRDFLVGEGFARAAGAVLLSDPHVTTIAGTRVALAHGDAQCTDDAGYMAFRAQVRAPQWQKDFLALPLERRKAIIAGMRDQSRAAQKTKSYEIMDVNQDAIATLFNATASNVLIHGHTHRPARHEYAGTEGQRVRHVLPDWDCDTDEPRGGWLGITADGAIRRYGLDGREQS